MRKSVKQFVTSQSMAADITSAVVGLDQDFGYSIQANYTTSGTLAGTLKLQASLDYNPGTMQSGGAANSGNWVDIDGSSQTITGAGSFVWNVAEVMYPFVRLVYTHAGGDSGSLNAYYQTRGF